MKLKLSLDEREALEAVLDSGEGWKVLSKVIDAFAVDVEQSVLKVSLAGGDRELVLSRARAEGARKLAQQIMQLKELALEGQPPKPSKFGKSSRDVNRGGIR